MPQIPTLTRSFQDRARGSAPSLSAATAVSRAVGQVASDVGQVANQFIRQQKEADDAAFLTESTNRLLREESERLADIETRGVDVDLESLQSDYQARVDEIAELAPSDEARQELLAQADNAFSRKFFPGYTRHQSGLNVQRRVNSTQSGLDDIQSEVLTGRTSVPEAVARAEAAIVGLEETAGGAVDIEALRQQTRSGIGVAHLTSRIQAGDSAAVIEEIQDGKWDSFTTTNELSAIQRSAIKAQADAESARQAQIDKQNALAASNLEVSVFRDQASYKDIDDAMNSGVITPAKRTQLYKQLDNNSVDRANVADNLTRVQTSLSMGIPLDPASKEDREGVEQMWQSIAADASQGTENEFANTAVSFVQSTGILPKSLKGTISAFARSGDQSQAVQAADIIGRMQAVNSPALNDLTKESYAFGLSVDSLVQGGVSPEKAVDIARESAFGQTPQDKKATSLVLKGASDGNVAFLNNRLDEFDPGIFSSQPEITPVMQAEFEVLLGEMLPFTNGDIDSARSMAWTSMRNVWGATTVNGGIQVMKYAPEAVYGKGGNNEWISEQFNSDMLNRKELLSDTGEVTSEGRPVFINQFGDFVTERTATVEVDGGFVNVPTVFEGEFLSEEQAVKMAIDSGLKDPVTGRKLKVFDTVESAVEAAKDRSSEIAIPEKAKRAKKPVPEKIKAFIGVDIKTARTDQPSYPVFTRNDDGIVAPLLDENNLPLRWKPEFSSSPAYKELQEQQDKNIEKAKFRRLIRSQRVEMRQKRLERLGELDKEFREATQ